MATKKSKTLTKSSGTKSTKKSAEKTAKKTEIKAPKTQTVATTGKSCLSGFFAKKYEEDESVLTIFKNHKFYGALLGEIIGTLLLTLLFFSLMLMGLPNIATYAFAVIALLIAVYAFSGACLNPLIAVGMMASRRLSVIRGIMYIVAEIVGAWLGWLIFNSFHLAGGDSAYDIQGLAAIADGGFWPVAFVELLGAVIIAFFFARALKYKRSVFTFGAVAAGGLILAVIVGYVVSAAFLGLSNNFIMNPAAAMMMNIFPTDASSFGEAMGEILQALSAYAFIPMIGGVVGFYLSDFVGKLSAED